MTASAIPPGTISWDVPLNAALNDLQGQTTSLQGQVTANLDKLVYNVKAHGATGNGTTDDTAAIQAAINAVQAAGGGVVYFPTGTYLVTPTASPALAVTGNGVRLVGAGNKAATLKKSTDGILLDMSGPSTDASGATHVRYCSIESLGVNGNGRTGLVFRFYYADNLFIRDVFISSNLDTCIDTTEFWDTRIYNLNIESCGSAADASTPNILLRNSAAASGFGYSADNVNQIHLIGCRFEDFFTGALWIQQGVAALNNPNGIYVTDCKFETSRVRGGPHLQVTSACRGVFATHLYMYSGGFYSGYTTAQNVIQWSGGNSALTDVLISNSSTATINSGVDLFSGVGTASLRNVCGQYNAAPTGAHVFFEASSSSDFQLVNCYSNSGTQSAGTVPAKWWGNSPVMQVAGPVADASFSHTPLNGTLALDTTNSRLYARIAGVWVYVPVSTADFTTAGNLRVNTAGKGLQIAEGANARMGTAVLVAGTVTVANTSVTANTRILLTSQVDGGTVGFLRVSTRTAATSFVITSSSATDTSTVAWLLVEP